MAATRSEQTMNPFSINFKQRLRDNRKMLVLISVCQLLGAPLIMLSAVLTTYYDTLEAYDHELSLMAYMLLGIVCLVVAVLCGVVVARNSFSYLFTKTEVDMIYSLPMSTKQRFWSNYLSGAAIYLVPYVIAMVLTLIVYGVGYSHLEVIRDEGSLLPSFLQIMLMGFLAMAFYYTLGVFVHCVCGAKLESASGTFLLIALVPSLIAVIGLLFCNDIYGMNTGLLTLKWLEYAGPIGPLFAILYAEEFEFLGYTESGASVFDGAFFSKWAAGYALIIAAVLVASWFLYKHRKAEDVSKPYVYRFFYYFIQVAVALCIFSIAKAESSFFMPALIFATLTFFTLDVITNRGFSKFQKSLLRYGVIFGGVGVFALLIDVTDGFGAGRYVPSAMNVRKAAVTYTGLDLEATCGEMYVYSSSDIASYESPVWYEADCTVEITDKDLIKQVIALQEACIAAGNASNSDQDACVYELQTPIQTDTPIFSFQIDYTLLGGRTVSRSYYLTYEQWQSLSNLAQTEGYRDMMVRQLEAFLEYSVNVDQFVELQTTSGFYGGYLENDTRLYKILLEDLKAAYRKDLEAMTAEEYLHSTVYCYLSGDYSYDFGLPVRSTFRNTIALLEGAGYVPDTAAEFYSKYAESYGDYYYDYDYELYENDPWDNGNRDILMSIDEAEDILYYYDEDQQQQYAYHESTGEYWLVDSDYVPQNTEIGNSHFLLNAPEDVRCFDSNDIVTTLDCYRSVYPGVSLTQSQFAELAPYLTPIYMGDSDCYTVLIDDHLLVVLPEGASVAEKILTQNYGR